MPLKLVWNKNFRFIEQKCIFEHLKKVRTWKNLENNIIFEMVLFAFLEVQA